MTDIVPPRPDLDTGRPAAGRVHRRAPGGRGSTWTWWEAVGVYLGCLFVTSLLAVPFVGAGAGPNDVSLIVVSAVGAIVTVGILVLWLSKAHPGWAHVVGFPTRLWPEVRAGVGFGLLLYPGIALGVGLVISGIVSALAGHQVSPPRQVPTDTSAFAVTVTAVYAILIAPVHEELFFRGILFRSIRDRYGFGAGATFSGLAFGLVHYIGGHSSFFSNLLLMVIMVFTGFALAFLYERRGNIVASMLAHATFNAIGVIAIFALR
jgi:membrane protease YdiL (CAAX protease family)